jgi:hypothetical protein
MDEIAMVSKNPASSDLTELGALQQPGRVGSALCSEKQPNLGM